MSDFDLYESEIEELYRPKEEPKVVLTIREAKEMLAFIEKANIDRAIKEYVFELFLPLKKGIEKAEKADE